MNRFADLNAWQKERKMKSEIKINRSSQGFSLVEIMVVIVILSILIGLLVPALGTIQKMAANVRQKAQFTTIGVGLEAFNKDFNDYPSSNSPPPFNQFPCGAQKLAEAMVGLDGYGFHKDSGFYKNGLDAVGNRIYDIDPLNPIPNDPLYPNAWAESLAARKGPYLELEVANFVNIKNLYPTTTLNGFVLSDRFGLLKNIATGKKAGMPIMYFRANTNAISLPTTYSHFDNYNLPGATTSPLMVNDGAKFYEMIWNPNFTINKRPYRSESYILISAGSDGIYGTVDDVTNFETE